MPLVEYIGNKPRKTDNVAGTGAVWLGQGDVRNVEDKAWQAMSLHPSVWRLAPVEPLAQAPQTAAASIGQPAAPVATPVPAPAPAPAEINHKYVLVQDGEQGQPSTTLVLDKMPRRDLDKLVAQYDIKVDEAAKVELDDYRAAVFKAVTGGTATQG